ncbi:SLC13 family permease [Elusimicrobiota bacterium]
MSIPIYYTIAVVVLMLTGLVLELASTDLILFVGLASFLLTGIISPQEALSGFSNQSMIMVAMLFVISQGVHKTGAIHGVVKRILRPQGQYSISKSLIKMMVPVSFMSSFLNNTAIVVMFVPLIKNWAEKHNISPSKFLIPLSYAAIFGGMCTLIGTSTNLVVHGLMIDGGVKGLSMFELAKIGLPCTLFGWLYIVFIGRRILPERNNILETVEKNPKEYIVEMIVSKECELIGKTVEKARLRNLKGLFLFKIERNGTLIMPVSRDEMIYAQDRLMFTGITSAIVELQDIKGLVTAAHDMFDRDFNTMRGHLSEAVVSSSSPVLGKTIKDFGFRSYYGAGVIAVHRNGERINEKIGNIRLKSGDTLLLLAPRSFITRWADSRDFYLVSDLSPSPLKAYHKSYVALSIVLLMILGATFGKYLPELGGSEVGMLHAVFAASILMILTRCVRFSEAKKAIRLDVLLTIACAFGIAKAVKNSGTSDIIAEFIISIMRTYGAAGVLAGIYFLTVLFTEIMTNAAAAALVFPIALSAATQLQVSPRPFIIAVAIAASASFATPIGYQTNLIVKGAGGYKFSDYAKVGLPLSLIFFIISVLMIPLLWNF